jgi:hypothetical protein
VAEATCACCENTVGAWVTMWSHPELPICYECVDYLNSRRERQLAILGGLQPLQGWDVIFSVLDVDRAVDHYQRLGFETRYHDKTYAFASWGRLVIHLALDEHPDKHMTGTIYIHVDDADELAAKWRLAGMEVADPENQDYGKREGHHVDPDGNLIRFGGPPR